MSLTSMAKQLLAFEFSVFVGAFVWIASPFITGHKEPWDSASLFLESGLFVGGFVAGFLVPRRFWLWALGILVGQIIGFVWCMATTSGGGGPLMLLGLCFFLPKCSLWGLLGSYLGAEGGKLFRKLVLGRSA